MKNIINKIAQCFPLILTADGFARHYKHHTGREISGEELRREFEAYRKAARKIKRVAKGKEGTTGPNRIPR